MIWIINHAMEPVICAGMTVMQLCCLGAAQILKDKESELKGSVKLMFQPGEETGAGARVMVENGALQDPPVDAGRSDCMSSLQMRPGKSAMR